MLNHNPNRPPTNLSFYLKLSQYQAALVYTYFGAGRTLDSREVPQAALIPPIGTWLIEDEFTFLDGQEIAQLREVETDNLEISEDTDVSKWADVYRYSKWLLDGREAPPIKVLQTDRGILKASDHRRLLAAKATGRKTIKAWVWPATISWREGMPMTGLTYEMARVGIQEIPVVRARDDYKIFPDDRRRLADLQRTLN